MGSDVKSLFPILSDKITARIFCEQKEKSNTNWQNIDERWLCLYIHLNSEKCSNLLDIAHLLPHRLPGRRGLEASMGSEEARRRHVKESGEGNWTWPEKKPNKKETKKLLGVALEIAIQLVFENFVYTFGGESCIQVRV